MRVLIVEDEPLLAEAVRDGLRREAIAADLAGDGDTALELLAVNAYDVAVLDRDVPGPSGDEIAARIVASGSGMPILMLTAADRIDDATRLAAGGSLAHRIRLPGRRDELRDLADAFDTMLARLEAHVGEQQRFAANASHELRTPLAVSKTLLDVAGTDPDHDTGELLDRLRAVNTRAIDLTEALLLLSRAGQGTVDREPVDLSLLAEDAAETLQPLADEHGVTIEVRGDAAPTTGSPALLAQLATNLVHNAIVHNVGDRGAVWVTTTAGPRGVELTVENTGEELDPAAVATFVEPFRRGSGRVRADHAGVGLGLAIVRAVTRAHDGTLTLTARPAGGLHIAVGLAPRNRVDEPSGGARVPRMPG